MENYNAISFAPVLDNIHYHDITLFFFPEEKETSANDLQHF